MDIESPLKKDPHIEELIINCQARVRGILTRKRYIASRNHRRAKSSHFSYLDQVETLNNREIDYELLYEENESEIQDMLKYKRYTYVETGSRYEG